MATHVCPLCGSEVRARNGNPGIAHLDGFAESLRLLVERERYALRDIAAMFGVSGERIRQIATRLGLNTHQRRGLHDYRVWNDAAHRFVPVRKSEITRQRELAKRARRRAAYNAKWDARETQSIAALRTLAAQLGRAPTIAELGEALGMAGANVGHIVAFAERHKDARSLWRRAGLEMRPHGHHGKKYATGACQ